MGGNNEIFRPALTFSPHKDTNDRYPCLSSVKHQDLSALDCDTVQQLHYLLANSIHSLTVVSYYATQPESRPMKYLLVDEGRVAYPTNPTLLRHFGGSLLSNGPLT